MSDLRCADCSGRLRWTIGPALGAEHTYCPDCHPERGPKDLFELLESNATLVGDVDEAGFESFSVRCPRCGETVCRLTAPEVNGFEAVCSGCEAPLYVNSALALADHYAAWSREGEDLDAGEERYESIDADVLGVVARRLWAAKARSGDHREGVLQAHAEDFGWDWEPPQASRGQPPEDVLEEWNEEAESDE
jgi:hypothetical protein